MTLKSFEEYVEDRHTTIDEFETIIKAISSELGIPYTLVEPKNKELPDQLKLNPKAVDEFWIKVAHACNLPAWVFGVEEKENERNV